MKSRSILATLIVFSAGLSVLVMAFFAAAQQAHAAGPWYVDAASGDDGNDCQSAATACATVEQAIIHAESGDVIHIAPGVYVENLVVSGEDLTFMGASAAQTILDGGGVGRVLQADNADVTLHHLTVQNGWNDDSAGGGGIYIYKGNLTIANAVLRHNVDEGTAGGAIRANGFSSNDMTLSLDGVLIENNRAAQGGAVQTYNVDNHLQNVAIVDNVTTEADSGALRFAGSDATLANVTISGNTSNGMHLSNFATITMTNSTVAHNEAYGLFTYHDGSIHNTIIAGNNSGGANCFISTPLWVESLGHNISGDDSCAFDHVSDQVNTDPKLQPLAKNGGDTLTHAIGPGSPALDAGDDAGCPITDQRGVFRPQDGDGDSTAACDIGAFEFAHIAPGSITLDGATEGSTNSSYTFQAAVAPATATQPLTYTWEATGQATVVQQGGITDTVSFTWVDPGAKTVSVTVDNGLGQVDDDHQITIEAGTVALTGVTLSGPTEGVREQEYTFTANVAPAEATVPITYTWQIDGGAPIVHGGSGLSDQLAVTWDTDGVHTVKVTADNGHGEVVDTHEITLTAWYVDAAAGDDGNDCQSPDSACRTVQAAVDRAPAGAVVHIAPGLYEENVTVDHSLYLYGAGSGQTILDGGQADTVLRFDDTTLANFEATLQGVTVQNGAEGGLYTMERLTMVDSVVQDNSASSGGGGIFNSGVLTLVDSTIRGNTAPSGAGLFNAGTAHVTGVTIHDNNGDNSPGVHTQGNGGTYLTNVTVSGNSGNVALTVAGDATLSLLNSTIAYNQDGGIASYATVTVQNSIIAYNHNDSGAHNCFGSFLSSGHNLEDTDTCGLDQPSDGPHTAALLAPLAYNGGPTPTHALQRGSPAIDAGDDGVCPATDQRGEPRPLDGDLDDIAACDIGAYEFEGLFKLNLPLLMR